MTTLASQNAFLWLELLALSQLARGPVTSPVAVCLNKVKAVRGLGSVGADSSSLHNIICFILLLQVISPEAEVVVPVTTPGVSRSEVMEVTRRHVSKPN